MFDRQKILDVSLSGFYFFTVMLLVTEGDFDIIVHLMMSTNRNLMYLHDFYNFLVFSLGRDIPFVAVYKTQLEGESETQDRESEYFNQPCKCKLQISIYWRLNYVKDIV